MTWKRKIPGEGACGPCCSWKERFNQLWDRAIGCIVKINNITPDGDGKFEIRGGTGVQITPISNGVKINVSETPEGVVYSVNGELPDENGDVAINTGVMTVNATAPDADGDFSVSAGSNITVTPGTNNIEISLASSPSVSGMEINGDLEVNGDIIQNGSAYETHAEQIFTKDDYVIMRDGAVAGLATGDYAGFQVKKYNGTNDGRLVIDKDGTARVGDVGDEQPLLTRDESASLTNGNLLQWNGTSHKAVDSGVNTSQIVRGSGNIGSDTKPVKVVNGVAVAVGYDVINTQGGQTINGDLSLDGNLTATGINLSQYTTFRRQIGADNSNILLAVQNPASSFSARLVLAITNTNQASLVVQKLNAQGVWVGEQSVVLF